MKTKRHSRKTRMELTTTADTAALPNEAAALDGVDVTSFVPGAATENARQRVLVRLLSQPASPTDAMRDLMNLPDLPERQHA